MRLGFAWSRYDRRIALGHAWSPINRSEARPTELYAGLGVLDSSFYRINFNVETLVQGSFPEDGDRERLRRIFHDSVEDDTLGMNTHYADGTLVCSYPIAMLVALTGS